MQPLPNGLFGGERRRLPLLYQLLLLFLLCWNSLTSAVEGPHSSPHKSKSQQNLQQLQQQIYHPDGTLRKGAYGKLLQDGYAVRILKLNQQLMANVPKTTLLKILKQQLEPYGYGLYLERYPRLTSYLIDIIQHPTALTHFFKAVTSFQCLASYWACFIFLLVIRFLLKRKNRRRKTHWIDRLARSLFIDLAFCLFNMAGLYLVFFREMNPFIKMAWPYL